MPKERKLKSKQQANFFWAVLDCKKKGKCPDKRIKDVAKSMTVKEIEEYLPRNKKEFKKLPKKVADELLELKIKLKSLGLSKEADTIKNLLTKLG